MPHDTHSMSDFGGVARQPEGGLGEQKVITALVGRLVNKVCPYDWIVADGSSRATLEYGWE
jgi:hypothetical protein